MAKRKTDSPAPVTQVRQGDILFELVDLPAASSLDDTTPKELGSRVVVAEGEKTGHNHALNGLSIEGVVIGGVTFYRADGPMELTHDEHSAHTLPEPPDGKAWRMTQQREFDPFARTERPVYD
jgi:hypothetical protein